MTTIYFIRHAQADNSVRDGQIRPLTEKGMADRTLVTEFLLDKNIDGILSSPFKRAIETIALFAKKKGLAIEIDEDFRERKSDINFTKETFGFDSFMERQWADFTYTYSDGECLAEVQKRYIDALNKVLQKYNSYTLTRDERTNKSKTMKNWNYIFFNRLAMYQLIILCQKPLGILLNLFSHIFFF